jgi:hypothetical protein
MATMAASAIVLVLAFVGATLHRALARGILDCDRAAAPIVESDLLLLGVLPGLAILGVLGTGLAIVGWLRADTFAGILLALMIICWRDTMATAMGVAGLARASVRGSLAIAAGGAVVVTATMLMLRTQVPLDIADIAVFQLPLARSVIVHHGFVYPQIPDIFYSYNPFFFNLLFAEAMMYLDRDAAAGAISVLAFLAFVGVLATFFRKEKAAGTLLTLFVLAGSSYFAVLAASPMIDVTRAVFATGALLFAYRYWAAGLRYDAVMAGLLIGAAAAGHYLELCPAAIVAICLSPRLVRGGRVWGDAVAFAAAAILVAGFWYLRNWLVTGNPIFPLVFAHPGLSDADMKIFMQESLATGPGNGGLEFLLTIWPGAISIALLAIGLVLGRARPWMLIVATLLMFIAWKFFMVNPRWAMDAMLALCATGIVAVAPLVDSIGAIRQRDQRILFGAGAAVAGVGAFVLQVIGHGIHLIPSWMDIGLLR